MEDRELGMSMSPMIADSGPKMLFITELPKTPSPNYT